MEVSCLSRGCRQTVGFSIESFPRNGWRPFPRCLILPPGEGCLCEAGQRETARAGKQVRRLSGCLKLDALRNKPVCCQKREQVFLNFPGRGGEYHRQSKPVDPALPVVYRKSLHENDVAKAPKMRRPQGGKPLSKCSLRSACRQRRSWRNPFHQLLEFGHITTS